MSVVYFIWGGNIVIAPRAEVRHVKAVLEGIEILFSSMARTSVPYNPDDDYSLDENDIQPWTDAEQALSDIADLVAHREQSREVAYADQRAAFMDVFVSAIDVDVTFRWDGKGWERTESRPQ